MAMACWRASVEYLGLDLRRDGGPALLDVRCADDMKIWKQIPGEKKHVVGTLLDKVFECGNK